MRSWALVVAIALFLSAYLWPRLLAPFNWTWLKLGLLLHACVSPVLMAVLFYSTLTPIGLVLRLFGRDLLGLRFDRAAATYWILRQPPGPSPDSMPRQF